jgi:hypothetical protein
MRKSGSDASALATRLRDYQRVLGAFSRIASDPNAFSTMQQRKLRA